MGQKGMVTIMVNSKKSQAASQALNTSTALVDAKFFELAVNESKARGAFIAHMLKQGMTSLTFTSPANGGTATPEQWAGFKRDVLLNFGTELQIKFGTMPTAEWNAHVRTIGTERAEADKKAKRDAQTTVSRKIGDFKKLAKQAEIREETGTAKGSVKPITERINAGVNKLINSINVNAHKAEPDPLNPEIKNLLKQVADLSK
jgi:hypothetical protein